ncbi:site-specific integrase [Pseudomonas sp. Irchel 3A7]|uniref:tyrosine-type recombinase/integrase n=1 Tax=Pseudomonas sp. Irchel 3A7 TaxID=2008913 RepID=UPI000BA3FBD6|nr:site-specific integrase [Pseudomonas sp. Irchel 3A7]
MHVTYVKIQRQTGTRYKAIIRDGDKLISTKTFILKKDASTWANDLLRDHQRLEALGNPKAKITLEKLAELYTEAWTGRDISRKGRVQALADAHGKVRLLDITESMIKADLKTYAKGRAPATVNRRKAAWSALFKFAVDEEYVSVNPAKGIASRGENNQRIRFLDDNERKALLIACDKSEWSLLKLLVTLAMTTGARLGELQSLRWEGIDLKKRTATLAITKNGDPRVLVFPAPAIAALMLHRKSKGLVFGRADGEKPLCFRKHWNKALKEAGLVAFRFHDLRHDAATSLINADTDLYTVGQILGHRSQQSTARYAHLSIKTKQAAADKAMAEVFRRLTE